MTYRFKSCRGHHSTGRRLFDEERPAERVLRPGCRPAIGLSPDAQIGRRLRANTSQVLKVLHKIHLLTPIRRVQQLRTDGLSR